MDVIDFDYFMKRYNYLMNNDPQIIRPDAQIIQIRQNREQQQQQMAAAQQADTAQKVATGAQTLSQTQVGGGQNALALALGRAA
jgi:hypothetical protein